MKIDVSIIVPVYNTEDYLDNCLESLVNMNYDKSKYEIIAINDCSTDGSLSILTKYEKKYNNIILFNLDENHGVSYARNIGIQAANGTYLMFCDSDDKYDVDTIKKFMNNVKKYNADFIIADYNLTKNNKSIIVRTTNYYADKNITKKEIVSYMTLTSSSKFIKKSLFIDNNIFYPENLNKCEELPVIPIVAYKAKKPIKLEECLYYYIQRRNSVSNDNSNNIKIDDLMYFDLSFEKFISYINADKYREEIEFRAIDHLLYGKCLVMLKSKISKKNIIKYIYSFKERYPGFMKNSYLKEYSFAKKFFVWCLNKKLFICLRILTFIHGKITG